MRVGTINWQSALAEMSGSEDDPESIDNAVLCMAWMWSDKTTVANAEKLVVKHFKHSYQDVYGALVLIWEKTGKVGEKKYQNILKVISLRCLQRN